MKSKILFALLAVVTASFGCNATKKPVAAGYMAGRSSTPNIVVNDFKVSYPASGKVKISMSAAGRGGDFGR